MIFCPKLWIKLIIGSLYEYRQVSIPKLLDRALCYGPAENAAPKGRLSYS